MVQVINKNPTSSQILGETLGRGLQAGLSETLATFKQSQEQKLSAAALGKFSGMDEDEIEALGSLPIELQKYVVDQRQSNPYKGIKKIEPKIKKETEVQSLLKPKEEKAALTDEELYNKGKSLFKNPQDLISKETDGFLDKVAKAFSAQAAMGYQPELLTQGIGGLAEGRTLGLASPPQPETGGGKVARETGKLLGLGKTAGQAQGLIERVTKPKGLLGKLISASAAGAGVSAAQQKIETGEIDPKQLGIDTAIWSGLEGLFFGAGKFIKALKGPVESLAKESGQTAEQVLQKAAQESGADLSKAFDGNAKEINKLKNSITKPPASSEKISKTEKNFFNKPAAIKERELFGAKLSKSPLDVHLKPEKPVNHTPETLAKQKETTERLTPLENKKWQELSRAKDEVRNLQAAKSSATGSDLERISASIKYYQEARIPRLIEELKDIQYELKYFRPRPTEAAIEADVKKSAEKYVKEAQNPTEKGQKDIKRQLDLDSQYLDRAEKLIERGELPGEIRPDTHIKMQKAYVDGYNAMIKNQRELISELKGLKDADSTKKINEAKKAIEYLEARVKRLKANVVNQTDKIKATRALEKPSGAFYRQQLKTTRQDLDQFKKDFFKHVRVKNKEQIKTSKTAQDKIKELKSSINEASKNPSNENINKVLDEAGAKAELTSLGNQIKEDVKSSENLGEFIKKVRVESKKTAEGIEQKVSKHTGSSNWGRASRRILTPERIIKLAAFTLSGGSAFTLHQVWKNYRNSGDIDSYLKALDSGDEGQVDRLILKFKEKLYSDSKIKSIHQAALARRELED